jgi:quercetin dioxygenase-like cupin family protein
MRVPAALEFVASAYRLEPTGPFKDRQGEERMNIVAQVALAAGLAVFTVGAASAQDPVKVDPRHYKVVFENAQVRVLRIHYGPHETSVMHDHPDGVVTYLADGHMRFLLPGGKTIESSGKAGMAIWAPGGPHKPTNLSDKPMDAVLVELKHPRAKK